MEWCVLKGGGQALPHVEIPAGVRLMMQVPVRVVGVEFSYPTPAGAVRALAGVDLDVAAGELVCLYGASGSGKSTLLSVIGGLEVPQAGSVQVVGREIVGLPEGERTDLRLRQVGLVFQEHNLVAQFTASENLQIVLRAQGCRDAEAESRRLLDFVGIGELWNRMPDAMSGGQRQRVGVARALAGQRPVMLCDEPTGALDSGTSTALFGQIRDLTRRAGVACLIATHDPLAERYADRVLEIVDGRLS